MDICNPTKELSYYEILNVPEDADSTRIREAFFKLSSTYQESNQALYSILDESGLEGELEKINRAYEVLSDPEKRKKYDLEFSLDQDFDSDLTMPLHPVDENFVTQSLVSTYHAPIRAKNCREVNYQAELARLIEDSDLGDGNFLRQLRRLAGIETLEMQSAIKISIGMLNALEENKFDYLPQPVYVKGFLRNFCNHLGVKDPEPIVKAYMERYEEWSVSKGKKLLK